MGGIYEIRDGHEISYIFANGKKIATITDTHTYYTHSDHLGSTSIVTDENGIIVEEIGYLPFGATLFRNVYSESTWESAYSFTGQEFDEESQLYNYNARLYDPIMCRFITPDTIVPDPYNPKSLNRYSYCLNNPLIYVDPSGHSAHDKKDEDGDGWVQDENGEWYMAPVTVTPDSWWEYYGFNTPWNDFGIGNSTFNLPGNSYYTVNRDVC